MAPAASIGPGESGFGLAARPAAEPVLPPRLRLVASRDDGPGPYAAKMQRWALTGDPADEDEPEFDGAYAEKLRLKIAGRRSAKPRAATERPAGAPDAVPADPVVPAISNADVPPLLAAPRDGKGDDLTLIWGVGEKLAARMNRMGVWHFDQIASWTPEQAQWFEAEIEGFKGRIERDQWIAQCRKLAAGWRPANEVGERVRATARSEPDTT
jgi:predicted flap endonuclease-1-like 5' DNA nuclease